MIRVNVLTGHMNTDQGPIDGKAAEVVRERHRLCPDVAILADVLVKHASRPSGVTIEQAGLDTWERGGADALIVSGTGTGVDPGPRRGCPSSQSGARRPRSSSAPVPRLPPGALAKVADGAIVGSSIKVGGKVSNPVDPERACNWSGLPQRRVAGLHDIADYQSDLSPPVGPWKRCGQLC